MFRVFRVLSCVRHGLSCAEKWTSVSPWLEDLDARRVQSHGGGTGEVTVGESVVSGSGSGTAWEVTPGDSVVSSSGTCGEVMEGESFAMDGVEPGVSAEVDKVVSAVVDAVVSAEGDAAESRSTSGAGEAAGDGDGAPQAGNFAARAVRGMTAGVTGAMARVFDASAAAQHQAVAYTRPFLSST